LALFNRISPNPAVCEIQATVRWARIAAQLKIAIPKVSRSFLELAWIHRIANSY
jgi:hypothetical protein